MSTLAKLGFHDWSGDTNVYDWLLLNFNSNNCGPEVVTYGLVTDLKDLLHLKRSKHEEVPRNKLSRQQLCHLLIYLVTRISSENVTKNFENGLFKRLTAKDKENHDPNEVWESGIQYIKQQSLGVIGAPQGEGSVGGEDGDSGGGVADGDQVRGGADSRWLWSYWPVHARGVRACTHGTELTVWEGCHKTNMVQKMDVRF